MNCLVGALETYHIYESKLNFEQVFSRKTFQLSSQTLLPLRLITQKSPQYFREKMNKYTKLSPAYGCGSSFSDVEGYTCVESMVTHYDGQSSPKLIGLAINAFILYHCLCAMEYLPVKPCMDGFNLFIASLLHQYIAAAR